MCGQERLKMAKKKQKKGDNKVIAGIIAIILAVLLGISVSIKIENDKYTADITYNIDQLPAYMLDDQGEVIEVNDEEIKTVEEIDGGKFEDADTGVSLSDGEYEDLGATVETFDTSTPEAFRNETLGKCVIANNRYGAQCVSLARSFWWSYANRDVSTCGTGMAKGMMNCADQNAGDDFVVYWKEDADKIQSGDWLVFDGGQYGHVGMALGNVVNGYVALLGENQGGHKCEGYGGSATNIINISIKNLIGFYRPKAYIKPAPTPDPETDDGSVDYKYVKGDYFSKVLVKLGLDEGKLWGVDGTVKFYTNQLIEQNVLDKNGNVIIGKPFTLVRR